MRNASVGIVVAFVLHTAVARADAPIVGTPPPTQPPSEGARAGADAGRSAPADRQADVAANADRAPRSIAELQLALGGAAAATQWSAAGDFAGYASGTLGVRLFDLFGIYVAGWEGYAPIDERSLTHLTLGAKLWGRIGPVRPFVRVAAIHQHEESRAAVEADPAGALFGVGDGIRHRAGGEGALGADVKLLARKRLELFGGAEAFGDWFPDPRGPAYYVGGGVSVGVGYAL